MADPTRPRLGSIRAVTHVVPDLSVIRAAYGDLLGYRMVEQGFVPASVAAAWAAPAMAGPISPWVRPVVPRFSCASWKAGRRPGGKP